MSEAQNYIEMMFAGLLEWMGQIFDAIPNSAAWIISVFALYSTFRFLIIPIVGGRRIRGSDGARKSGVKNNGHSSEDTSDE